MLKLGADGDHPLDSMRNSHDDGWWLTSIEGRVRSRGASSTRWMESMRWMEGGNDETERCRDLERGVVRSRAAGTRRLKGNARSCQAVVAADGTRELESLLRTGAGPRNGGTMHGPCVLREWTHRSLPSLSLEAPEFFPGVTASPTLLPLHHCARRRRDSQLLSVDALSETPEHDRSPTS